MRNVIVTGGTRGLGLCVVLNLATAGYRVIAVARKPASELDAAAAHAYKRGRGAIAFRSLDLSMIDGIGPFVMALRKEFGPVYGLVNNAGLGTSSVLSMMRDEAIEQLVRVNTVSPIVLTKYVLRSMMLERAGRVVNISSIVSAAGYTGLSAYSATKASLVGFTRSLAREVGQLGITVNSVAPGFLDTDMTQELKQDQRERIVSRSAMRRLAEPGDIAEAVQFLLSEGARNITGITLTVDAGSTA